MSAELLREAASRMRSRAEAATPGPWEADHDGVWVGAAPEDPLDGAPSIDVSTLRHEDDAEHIASWHPAVALAVADWLDSTANDVEHVHTPIYNLTSTTVARALAVARAYLGRES